jgi:hypothetical protein
MSILADLLHASVTCSNLICKLLILIGSSGRIRTYNPSVNSRAASSRPALQTRILTCAKTEFPWKLGGLWGYLALKVASEGGVESLDRVTIERRSANNHLGPPTTESILELHPL